MTLGMSLVMVSGGIDLSLGSLVALGGVAAGLMAPYGTIPALVAGLTSATLVGAVNGSLVSGARLQPFVVTLFTASAARGLALSITHERSIALSPEAVGLVWLGRGFIAGVPIPVIIVLILYATSWLMLRYSRIGLHMYALGDNEDAARLMGVKTGRTKVMVYTISGFLSGLAGVLLVARLGAAQPLAAGGWESDAIAAAVLGGTFLGGGQGGVFRTLCGVLLLGMTFNLMNLEGTITPWWQLVLRGGFLLAVVVFQERLAEKRVQSLKA